MKKILTATASMIALTLGYVGTANAQTINYGSLEELFGEPVTTSATGKPQKASDVPVAMDIISAADIRRSGAQSIPQILGRVNGMSNWQGTRSWADVGMRGQNTVFNPTMLVLINGRQVYLDTYGYTDWSLIPVQLEEIRQIEVVKGPNTALFGFNAVSGVINIVTYNPKYDNINEVGGTLGTGQYRQAHAIGTVSPTDWASVRVSGSAMGANEVNKEGVTRYRLGTFAPEDHTQDFNADALFQINDKTQLRLEGSLAEANTNDNVFLTNSVSHKRNSGLKAGLTTQTGIGLVQADVYQNELFSSGFSPVIGQLQVNNKVTVAQLQDLFKIGSDHSFRIGGEYRYNRSDGGALYGGQQADIFYSVWAGSAMWNWAITPAVEITNAVRVDTLDLGRRGPFTTPFTSNANFDESITTLSENSGVVWKATNVDTFRASFARGVQAPSLVSYGIDLPVSGGAVIVAGNPRLEPSIVTNYEIGYDRDISAIGGKLRTDVYYKTTRDIFVTSARTIIGAPVVQQAGNIGDTKTIGFEAKLNGTIQKDWTWDLGYAYQSTDDNFTVNNTVMSVPLNFEDTFPHHVVNAHLGWAKGAWEVDGYGQFASNYYAITQTAVAGVNALAKVDAFATLAGRVAYTLDPGITIALSGANLQQSSVATNPGLEEERQVFLSLSKKF